MKLVALTILGLLSFNLLVGCTSTTTLKSTSGAKIYADGKYLGEGNVVYSDQKIAGSSTVIELKKEGFENKTAAIKRSGQINVGALVGGILLAPTLFGLLFFLWVTDYEPYYVFELEPNKAK